MLHTLCGRCEHVAYICMHAHTYLHTHTLVYGAPHVPPPSPQLLDTPTGVLADAAVVAAIREGEYGRYRKWGAVGWGGMAVVSGALIDHVGMGAAFALGVALVLPALVCGWNLHEPMRAQLAARQGALARLQWVQAKRTKAKKALAARQLSPVSVGGV